MPQKNTKQMSSMPPEQSLRPGYAMDDMFLARLRIGTSFLIPVVLLAMIYFLIITFRFTPGSIILFSLLIAGEIFHLGQLLAFAHTVRSERDRPAFSASHKPSVDVFITVAGEPMSVIRETVQGAKAMRYRNKKVYVLNDGYVTEAENWKDVEALCAELGVTCLTRRTPGGAKAGNINHALGLTRGDLVAVFDADHVPHPDFLEKTAGYFTDKGVGFVQTPQFYKNAGENLVTAAAWEQQELFYGAICQGKDRMNAVFMCGTNMLLRRAALDEVGGLVEDNIAEDILTSQFIHERGWKSVYVPEVLARGLAPQDLLSYVKQQFRWARGSLELIFRYNPLFRRGLTWAQRLQYLASASYYLSGVIVLMNALLPVVFLYSGIVPLNVSTMALAIVFLPYIFGTVYLLLLASKFTYTFRALSFSMAAWPVHLRALWANLTRRKSAFQVTSKEGVAGFHVKLILPHLLYILLVAGGLSVAVLREGVNASVVTNMSWALFNIAAFSPYMLAALPERVLSAFGIRSRPVRAAATAEEVAVATARE